MISIGRSMKRRTERIVRMTSASGTMYMYRGGARRLMIATKMQSVTKAVNADALPTGADVISLVRVVHDHDDAVALGLLRATPQALPEDGVLLLAEPMSGTSGAEPIGDAYFGFYLLAMGSGRPRTPERLRTMLASAGFSRSKLLATRRPMLTRLMLARA